jgi:2-C-methyl-D-erythritol 2,4-cyclodiphosphate synthase
MVGFGYDVHKLSDGKKMILGGVLISDNFGTIAHSDGDVLAHSVIDALLGAAGLGDIGEHFPDTDNTYKGADSMKLLAHTVKLINNEGYKIINIDALIQLEKPKLKDFKEKIKNSIADICRINPKRVNIKAGTNEKMGFIGRSEGIGVFTVCQLEMISNNE